MSADECRDFSPRLGRWLNSGPMRFSEAGGDCLQDTDEAFCGACELFAAARYSELSGAFSVARRAREARAPHATGSQAAACC